MNQQLKTVLLTVLTLSLFVIALVELSGVSSTALFNKFHIGSSNQSLDRRDEVKEMPKTTMQFYEKTYNFGNLNEGDTVRHVYRFKNTGTNPLMISKVDVTCGCTSPSFTKAPVAPGADGEISIGYNSNRHPGHQQKNIIVHSNAVPDAVSISFEAEVKAK